MRFFLTVVRSFLTPLCTGRNSLNFRNLERKEFYEDSQTKGSGPFDRPESSHDMETGAKGRVPSKNCSLPKSSGMVGE